MEKKEYEHFSSLGIICKDVIAKGGYGTILLVYSTQYKAEFALKKVPLKGFNQLEIETLTSLDHRNIISLYKCYRYNSFVYLLMEYCVSDLDSFIRKNKNIDPQTVRKYCFEILQALKACHDKKIAHGDIKPSNFLIDSYGRLKICDFGLSSLIRESFLASRYTGTPLFMSPELIKKEEYNAMKSDIWAAGVTFYFLATRKYPFRSETIDSLKEVILTGQYKSRNISDLELQDVISMCLKVDPNDRASIDELLSMPYFRHCYRSSLPILKVNSVIKNSLKAKPTCSGRVKLPMNRQGPINKWSSCVLKHPIQETTPSKLALKTNVVNFSLY
ncbi:CAMK family protein kinase [Trichomonas vaginalis G3]|uniref:CAMK family protein kinase n=1 Tax=Trichomonas vaginalis (strain ATCC PRA-98 / G3) TaxID=412133 RepID=A2FCT8_TRIV3|nr:protein serine/threonine kinase protein [Trichomonas vaginalis G3]EAX97269.1 CAMK family protein kinase [Trichomonas vaginalis G3]KAI5550768.1 protein serine/threonine kinase protein [Trichomonas vaginalis G3]|eukprot:XP_001310199.1 CAMK family protein kinase [Trichomonas vaginalis G3]